VFQEPSDYNFKLSVSARKALLFEHLQRIGGFFFLSNKRFAILALAWVPALAQSGGYIGPQILTRGSSTGDRGGAAPTGFQFYAGVNASYETGIVPAAVDSEGHIIRPGNLFGIFANIGAYGHHNWRHTTLGLDYSGNFRHYTSKSSLDGSDHTLGLSIATQVSRRLQLFTIISAGTFSRYSLGGFGTATDLLSAPGYGVFDNRATFLEITSGATYQLTSRMSFTGSGSGFTVRRQSTALVGLNGYSGKGSLGYRLDKLRTLTVSYAFTHFDYPRGFGESNLHTYLLGISQKLGKRWDLSLSAGAARISTTGVEQVAADPITAALFGNAVTVQVFNRSIYSGSGEGRLRGTFKRSRVEIYYTQIPSAGNGVYLTSKQSAAGGSYGYSGIRKASFSIGAAYNRMSSVGQTQLGKFNYASASMSGSYKLLPSLETFAEVGSRNLQIDQSNGFSRFGYRVAFGFNWHPGEVPISFW
jgi:hypothetical protein